MQFIESNMFGVRAACIVFRGPEGSPEVLLLPMIHIGASAFYIEVKKRIESCDALLYEGVKTRQASVLQLSYSLISRRRRLGLVTQSAAIDMSTLGASKIHADLAPAEFVRWWKKVPLIQRLGVLSTAPLQGIRGYLFATRQSIAAHLCKEEVESDRESRRSELFPNLDDAIVRSRDRHLLDVLKATIDHRPKHQRVGILFGAGHMRSVSRMLTGECGYYVAHSEWMTVFDIE